MVESALVMAADGVIGVSELPERIIDHALSTPEGTALGEGRAHEQVMVELALARFKGDKAKAARYIGWSPSVLEKTSVKAVHQGRYGTLEQGKMAFSRAWILAFLRTSKGWARGN